MGIVKKATSIPGWEIELPELFRRRDQIPADEPGRDYYLDRCDQGSKRLPGRFYFRSLDDDQAMDLTEAQVRGWRSGANLHRADAELLRSHVMSFTV